MARLDTPLPGLGARTLVPRLVDGVKLLELRLTTDQAFVLSRVDGRTTLGQIVQVVPFPESQTAEILRGLLDERIVEVPGIAHSPASPSRPAAPPPMAPPRPAEPAAASRMPSTPKPSPSVSFADHGPALELDFDLGRSAPSTPITVGREASGPSIPPPLGIDLEADAAHRVTPPPMRAYDDDAPPLTVEREPPRAPTPRPSPSVPAQRPTPSPVAAETSGKVRLTPGVPPLHRKTPRPAPATVDGIDLSPESRKRIDEMLGTAVGGDARALLGVTPESDERELRRAYFRLAKEFHPDRFYGKELGPFRPKLEALFGAITDAFNKLLSTAKR